MSIKFVKNQFVDFEETRHIEFKEVKGLNPVDSIKNTADEYVVAFLNCEGGSIFWGISDSREIIGVPLNHSQRDFLKRVLNEKLFQIEPTVAPSNFKIIFHPVFADQQNDNPIQDLVILEIQTLPGNLDSLYSTGSSLDKSRKKPV